MSLTQSNMTTLAFYDHHRQGYWHLGTEAFAEFMVGGYPDKDGGVDERGEFKITLERLDHDGRLSPRLCVYADAYGALRAATDAGLLDALEEARIESRDDLSRLLTGLGFRDRSDHPVGWVPERCEKCGQKVR